MFVAIISFILTILYLIWLSRLISFGVTTATRIAVATEATALGLNALYDALAPEAKERVAQVQEQRRAETRAAARRVLEAYEAKHAKIEKPLSILIGVGAAVALLLIFIFAH